MPAFALLILGVASSGAATPEQMCAYGRAKAAGKYAKCIEKNLEKTYLEHYNAARFGRCVAKYVKTWTRLQAITSTPACDVRYVDNGDGTATDNLTALQWEQKTDDATVHDKDNGYGWTNAGVAGDGTVFTSFLSALNGTGFAGQRDWRLPTVAELLTIAEPPYPSCTAGGPCIDLVFGPTWPGFYWTSSTNYFNPPAAWGVSFFDSDPFPETKTYNHYARAVRGGF